MFFEPLVLCVTFFAFFCVCSLASRVNSVVVRAENAVSLNAAPKTAAALDAAAAAAAKSFSAQMKAAKEDYAAKQE